MTGKPKRSANIREYILRSIPDHQDVVAMAVRKFDVSRAAVSKHIRRLTQEGYIQASGKTKARRYELVPTTNETFPIRLTADLPEDHIFRFRVLPFLEGVPQNIVDICQYGFTEMFNNAVDHSASQEAIVSVERNYSFIKMQIQDTGIGIFEKIRAAFDLTDARSALLELSKGKLTTDKKRHSGEGIFFTSRMFSKFEIMSGPLYYIRSGTMKDGWLIESREQKELHEGTCIFMQITTNASWSTRDVFNEYQHDNIGFRRTHVPVRLARYPGEQLVSRSQAKRLLARFEQFSEVMLDFTDVQEIGQPFADEIFRVYAESHPRVDVIPIAASPDILKMIGFVKRGRLAGS